MQRKIKLQLTIRSLIALYDPKQGNFIAKLKGNTFAEVDYAGLKDTIYFVLEGTPDVTTHIPNTKYANYNVANLGFSVYPNPAKSFTTISSTDNIERIEICDISGRTIQRLNVNSTNYLIDLKELSKGVYIIKGFILML